MERFVARKFFETNMKKYEPTDPLYETYTDAKGKQRRRKREVPPGLSSRDAKILKSVNKRAHYLDKGFSLCGLRFGWTFIIGLIPGAGVIADGTLNYVLVVRKAKKAEIPPWLLRRLLLNNAVAAALGFVPLLGDIGVAIYKTNSRNAALLEEFLRIRGAEYLRREAIAQSGAEIEGEIAPEDVQFIKPGAGIARGELVSAA